MNEESDDTKVNEIEITLNRQQFNNLCSFLLRLEKSALPHMVRVLLASREEKMAK